LRASASSPARSAAASSPFAQLGEVGNARIPTDGCWHTLWDLRHIFVTAHDDKRGYRNDRIVA
jgi:hypothetical protein